MVARRAVFIPPAFSLSASLARFAAASILTASAALAASSTAEMARETHTRTGSSGRSSCNHAYAPCALTGPGTRSSAGMSANAVGAVGARTWSGGAAVASGTGAAAGRAGCPGPRRGMRD
jgi:hypothetical protein